MELTVNGAGDASWIVDLGSAQTVNCVGIAAHNAGTLGATCFVQYSTSGTGGPWTTIGGITAASDDQSILWYFEDTSAQYWRVFFDTSGSGDVVCGVISLGVALTIERRIYQGYRPPLTPTEVALQSNVSEGGHLLGSSVTKKASTASADLTYLDPATIRGAAWQGFQNHYNNGGGFFWAWRPTKYGDVHYAWRMGGALAPTNSGPKDYMAAKLEMRLYDEP